jgi:hypothetical protein
LPLTMWAVTDSIAKSWFSTAYSELKGYEHFKTLFTKFLWNSPTQFRIRCSIYQDKFTRQDGESMVSHYLRYANLAANLKSDISEEDSGNTDLALPNCRSKIIDKWKYKYNARCNKPAGKIRCLGSPRRLQEPQAELRPPWGEPATSV